MGFRAVRFSLLTGREAASARGAAPPGATAALYLNSPLAADPSGAAGLIALPPLRDVHLVSFDAVGTDQGPVLRASASEQEVRWWQELAAAQAYLTNASLLALSDTTARASGVLERVPHIRVAGNALAAYAAAPSQISGILRYTSTDGAERIGPQVFTEFLDDAVDVPPSRANLVASLWSQAGLPGQALLGVVNNVPQYAGCCQLAKPGADGFIWTKPGDVGLAVNQIPPTLAANDPSRYRFFPSYFGLRTNFVQRLAPLGAVPAAAVTTAAGSLPVFQVDRPPTHSRWLVGTDGTTAEVLIAHPTNSDLRTPLQIWNQVWIPALGANNLLTYTASISSGRTFAVTGRLQPLNLDFVSFIEPLDGSTSSAIYSAVTQT